MEKEIIKQLIIDKGDNFLYLEIYDKSNEYGTKSTVLLVQTKDFIDIIPFSQQLIPTFTINQLIRYFKSNENVLDIIHTFYYKNILKFD